MDMSNKGFVYDFNNERRGIALLIHNEVFDKFSGYKDRPGDSGDFIRMQEIFTKLGFEVDAKRNLTGRKIFDTIQKVSQSKIHEKSDCFVCVIASHGEEMQIETKNNVIIKEHVIVGSDGQCVKTRDIVEMFNEDNCEGLRDKPKFFFIQPREFSNREIQIVTRYLGGNQMVSTDVEGDGTAYRDVEIASAPLLEPATKNHYPVLDIGFDHWTQRRRLDVHKTIRSHNYIGRGNCSTASQACRTSNTTVLGMDSGHILTITERKQPPYGIDNVEDMHVDSKITDNVDVNYITEKDNLDTRHMSTADTYLSRRQLVHQVTDVECPEDTLLMFASLSNNFAVRNSSSGGWLLTSLYSQIKEHIETGKIGSTEFTQILNGALKEMTTKNFKPSDTTSRLYGAFSPGCFTHCLSRDVLFLEKEYR